MGVKVWLDGEDVTIEGNIPVSHDAIESTPSLRHYHHQNGLYLARL
ncbi:MAG TPA: hypothetical protein G4O06_00865 [Dehalococcoidia bacterium]|nr:hypothetical protein [Dehalococcoidia bacterium]